VGSPQIRGNVPPEELAQLTQELQKLVSPIVSKREELQAELQKWLSTTKSTVSLTSSLENTPISGSILPPVGPPHHSRFRIFVASPLGGKAFRPLSSFRSRGNSCSSLKTDSFEKILEAFYQCVEEGSFVKATELRMALLDQPQILNWLPWLGGVQALKEKKFALAEHQIQKSLDKNPGDPLLTYTQALALASQSDLAGKLAQADLLFSRALDLGFDCDETRLAASYQEFLMRNWLGSLQHSEKIPIDLLGDHGMLALRSEALAQSGNLSRAISEQQRIVRSYPSTFSHLQMARIQESFNRDNKAALTAYEAALTLASSPEMKDHLELKTWIREKIAWIKGQTLSARVADPRREGNL
jgi:tetratricopeptide (TPR) repeat protein